MTINDITGFKFKGINEENYKDSSDFNIFVKLANIPLLPQKNDSTERPLGSNISYDFEDGYSKKTISILCQFSPNGSVFHERRYGVRDIVQWLSKPGYLILNCESDRIYSAKLTSQVDYEITNTIDIFTLNFEVQPLSKSIFNNTDGITWGNADIIWSGANFQWQGIGLTVSTNNINTTINNIGNFRTLPIIKLSGTSSSVTITCNGKSFTYFNLSNETVYIDCEHKLVYKINGTSKVNKINNFTGDFIYLEAGDNNFIMTSNSSISLEVEPNTAYL